jgi:hypothetical protein
LFWKRVPTIVGAPREKKGFEEKFGCEMGISVDDLFQIMFLFFVQLPKFNCVLRNVYFAYCGSNFMRGGECSVTYGIAIEMTIGLMKVKSEHVDPLRPIVYI